MKDAQRTKTLMLCLAALFMGFISPSLAITFLADGQTLNISPKEIEQRIIAPQIRLSDTGQDNQEDPEPAYILIDDMRFPVKTDGIGITSAFTGTKWTIGNVYYVFDENVNETNKQRFQNAAAEWSAVANLTFTEGTGSGNYIHVQSGSGNWSYVGMIGGKQILSMYNWSYKYIIVHEIGHALGLAHEQSRSDRDSYVTILWDNIIEGKEGNFSKLSSTNFGLYDFDSVMHYSKGGFSSNGGNTIEPKAAYSEYLNTMGQRSYLSSLDKSGMISRYGIKPALAISPSPVSFGTWPVGGIPEINLTIQKVGPGGTSGTASVSSPYTILTGAAYSLSEGQSQQITIRYSPTSAGSHNQTLSFSSGESASVNGVAVSTSDSDGDGVSDWNEYVAGTSPTNPNDSFFLYPMVMDIDGNITFEFPTKSGRRYQLQSIDNLIYGSWTDIGDPVDGNNTTKQLNAASSALDTFYRVSVTIQP